MQKREVQLSRNCAQHEAYTEGFLGKGVVEENIIFIVVLG